MRILICGADGFLGRHLARHLEAAGHAIVRGVHRPRLPGDIAIDYARDTDPAVWLPRLANVDAVINAVGILIETREQPFAALHAAAPIALFDACVLAGVDRVLQVSALGADAPGTSYLATKAAADAHLARLPLQWAVLRPSIIYGDDGASSRFFRGLATLPIIGLPGRGDQRLQPIHVDDLCACAQALIAAPGRRIVELAGPRALTYRELLAGYRQALGLGRALWLPIPTAAMGIAARVAEIFGSRVLSRDTLAMLARGNTTVRDDAAALLGRPSRDPKDFIAPERRAGLRAEAVAAWSLPLLRFALALIWLAGGLLPLTAFSVERSLELLVPLGLSGSAALAVLYFACGLDIVCGLLTLARPGRGLWAGQALLVTGYSLILAWAMPAAWLHPFGPVVKNLLILAVLAMLFAAQEPRRPSWTI